METQTTRPEEVDELEHIKIILLRLKEEGIISDSKLQEIGRKTDLTAQKADIYNLQHEVNWNSAIRILQLMKFVDVKPNIRKQVAAERNPLLVGSILKHIFGFLTYPEIKNGNLVCKAWNKVADPILGTTSLIRIPTKLKINGQKKYCGIQEFNEMSAVSKPRISEIHIEQLSESLYCLDDFIRFFEQTGDAITDLTLSCLRLQQEEKPLGCYDITPCLAHCRINILKIDCPYDDDSTNFSFFLDVCSGVSSLYLDNCSIHIRNELKICPTKVILKNVRFHVGGSELKEIPIHDFVDFSNANIIGLYRTEYHNSMSLDISTPAPADQMDSVTLNNVRVDKWSESDWVIFDLDLTNVDFVGKVSTEITNLSFDGEMFDLCALPPSIEILKINCCKSDIMCSKAIVLYHLKRLHIINDIDIVGQFDQCPVLKEIELEGGRTKAQPVQLKDIATVTKLKLTSIFIENCTEHRAYINTLILNNYSFSAASDVLNHVRPLFLILKWNKGETFETEDSVIPFLKKANLRYLVIGPVHQKKFQDSELSKLVDSNGKYLLFRSWDTGTTIKKKEFHQLMDLAEDNDALYSKLCINMEYPPI